jgi:hypothetical protein
MSELGMTVKSTKRLPLAQREDHPTFLRHSFVKFLIGECLHTSLLAVAQDNRYDCFHVNWSGLSVRLTGIAMKWQAAIGHRKKPPIETASAVKNRSSGAACGQNRSGR